MPAKELPSARGYEESTAPEWTEIAFEELQDGRLQGEVITSHGVVRSRVWGECPACGHGLDDRQTHSAVTSAFGGEWRGTEDTGGDTGGAEPVYFEVDVSCGCEHAHPGAPSGRIGCGASFRVELLVETDESGRRA